MNLIFDLDGTIIDSSNGIYEAYKISIENILQPIKKKYFISKIGPPIQEIIRDLYPSINEKNIERVRKLFRNNYDNGCFLNFEKYNQIDFIIRKLAIKNRCFIVTNKPTYPSQIIIKKLNLQESITEIIGVDFFDQNGQSKTLNLSNLINTFSLDINKCIYIGDTLKDYLSAKENRISFLGFIGGYYNWSDNEIEEIKNFYNKPNELIEKLEIIKN